MTVHRFLTIAGVAAALLSLASSASANDTLTFSITATYAWDASPAAYGKKLGFFAENGIDLEIASTDTGSDNLQAVIGASADVGVVGVPIFIGAAVQGAPIKMIASAFKGNPDYLWYVRADSPLHSLKEVTEKNTIGVSSLGASSYIALSALLDQYGVKGNIIAVGSSAAAMTQVMSGQLDVGTDGNGLLGVPQWTNHEVRILAYGRELELVRDVTGRGIIASEETVAKRRDVLVRFMKAYQKAVDWMYTHPQAVEWFAEQTQSSVDEARRVVDNCYPEAAMQIGDVTGVALSVKQGIQFKRIAREPTAAELADMFDIVWTPAKP